MQTERRDNQAGGMRDAMYEEKLEHMIEVGRQVRNAQAALAITVGELRPLRSGAKHTLSLPEGEIEREGELKSLKDEAKYTFQEAYEYLNGMDPALDVGVSLERLDLDSGMPPPHNPRLLQQDFQFSDDPETFSSEFKHVRWLFAYTKGEDETVDFLAMRVLSHAGKLLAKLEAEGEARSNKMTKMGLENRKGYVSHKQVVDEAKKVKKGITSKFRIASIVRERLLEAELHKKQPKKVHSEDYIRKHLLPKN